MNETNPWSGVFGMSTIHFVGGLAQKYIFLILENFFSFLLCFLFTHPKCTRPLERLFTS